VIVNIVPLIRLKKKRIRNKCKYTPGLGAIYFKLFLFTASHVTPVGKSQTQTKSFKIGGKTRLYQIIRHDHEKKILITNFYICFCNYDNLNDTFHLRNNNNQYTDFTHVFVLSMLEFCLE